MMPSGIRLLAGLALLLALCAGVHPAHAATSLTLTVTTTFDADDPTPVDAVCDTPLASPAAGKCSLRAAVDTANNQGVGVSTTINLPVAKQHYLVAPAIGEIILAHDAGGMITINGAQRTGVVVDGGGVANITDFRTQSDSTLRNLTITGGNNPQAAGVGGVDQEGGNLTMTNVRLTGNTGNLAGGLYQGGAGTLTITNAEIDHNATATGSCGFCGPAEGGGLTLNGGGNTTLAYDDIMANSTVGFGGGMYAGNVLATVIRASNLVIVGNSAQLNGGGISALSLYGTSPQMILTNSLVENNISQNPAHDLNTSGGGIYSDTYLQLADTQVTHNTVGYLTSGVGLGGGVADGTNGTSGLLVMTGGSISGNIAGFAGGGLDDEFSATLNGVAVSGNRAGDQPTAGGGTGGAGQGGGVYAAPFSTLHLVGGSVASNDAGQHGGGVGVFTHDLQIDGTRISTNLAGGTSICPGFGGGVYMNPFNDVPPTQTLPHPGIHAATISSNTSEDSTNPGLDCPGVPSSPCTTQGGGIDVTNATLLADAGTHVVSNRSCNGAGVYLGPAGGLTFSGVASLNIASGQGGAMYLEAGSLGATITGSRIVGNRAVQTGGIYNLAPITITGSLISGNAGSSGCLNLLMPCL